MMRVAILRYPGTWSERDFQHALSLVPGRFSAVYAFLSASRSSQDAGTAPSQRSRKQLSHSRITDEHFC